MPRYFDGTDDAITFPKGAYSLANSQGSAYSFACLVQRRDTTQDEWQCIFGDNAANGNEIEMCIVNKGGGLHLPVYYDGEHDQTVPTPWDTYQIQYANRWYLLAWTHAASGTYVRAHLIDLLTRSVVYHVDCNYGSNHTHNEDRGDANITTVYLGKWMSGGSDYFNGDLALAAWWNRALSDAETETLAAGAVFDWIGMAPACLWVFDQENIAHKVGDWTGGGANESSITGTTVSTTISPLTYGSPVIMIAADEGVAAPPADLRFSRRRAGAWRID